MEELPVDIQAEIIAYDRVASYDESKERHDRLVQLAKAMTPRSK